MPTPVEQLGPMQVEKLSRQNRRLKRALAAVGLLTVGLLIHSHLSQPPQAWAQNRQAVEQNRSGRGMWFDGQQVVIGMTRTEALGRLSKCCRLTGRPDSYFILKRGERAEITGALWFKGDAVTSLKRDLEYYPSADAVRLARTVYHEILSIAGQGQQVVTLNARTTELANGTCQDVELMFASGRSLAVEVASVDDPKLTSGVSASEYQR